MKQLTLVFLGGGLGSTLRYGLSTWLKNYSTSIPYATFAANIIGSLIIGLILGLAIKNETFSHNTTLFLATGFCGGFTTFSAFAYENHLFLKNGDVPLFLLYTMASLAIGVAMVFLGIWLVKIL